MRFYMLRTPYFTLIGIVAILLLGGCVDVPGKVELKWDPLGIDKRAELEVELDRLKREKPLIKRETAPGNFEMTVGPFEKDTLVLLTGDFRVSRKTAAASCKFLVNINPALTTGDNVVLKGGRGSPGNNIEFSASSEAVVKISKNTLVTLSAKTELNDANPLAMTLSAFLFDKDSLSNLASIK